MPIQVVVVGAAGRMGSSSTKFFMDDPAFEVVGLVDRTQSECPVSSLPIETDIDACLDRTKPDVTLVFTTGKAAGQFALASVSRGIPTVIGSSGVDASDVETIKTQTDKAPCLLVPNFSVGAVLMMQFAQKAAKYFPNCEIIELHHEKKIDAPSGTAIRTAQMIAEARTAEPLPAGGEEERGISVEGINIHSVRLPGLLAHQEVLFGRHGELLTLRHDSLDRSSFELGIKLCCAKVRELKGFVVGMEHLL
ncbi:MAG: 4-hydroxy-tetrahydrodipicolinate reductase [Armatimonadetes bacterium]|nr:4-hydroxy-tetrahydrodipicolinate reductase [Armatimonadota bacterium]